MMKKMMCCMIAALLLFACVCPYRQAEATQQRETKEQSHVVAVEDELVLNDEFVEAVFLSEHGNIPLLLKKGFDFINRSSSELN